MSTEHTGINNISLQGRVVCYNLFYYRLIIVFVLDVFS